MTTLLQIGERLREIRKEKGLYKIALAERSGVNRNTLHSLESGTGNVELNTLLGVCDELGLDILLVPKSVSDKQLLSDPTHVASQNMNRSFITRAINERASRSKNK
jgi:transcriptional regulator with XRE-family HTH domain